VKLVVNEPESAALRRFLRRRTMHASCGLARVEVRRAVAAEGRDAANRVRRVLAGIYLIELADPLLDAAGDLEADLRSLDAIHVTAARTLGDDLDCVVTYDRRMSIAATAVGLTVAAPA
jgi:predicted nucleic acid-binding protein